MDWLSPVHSPLPRPSDRVVDHAIAGQRAVAEHVHHQRHARRGRRIPGTRPCSARRENPRLAGGAIARVIVEAAHGDGAGAGVAVDHHLHHGGGLAEFGVAVVFGLGEDAGRPDDHAGRCAGFSAAGSPKRSARSGRLHVAALHQLLDDVVLRDRLLSAETLASFLSLMRSMDSITSAASCAEGQQADQLAGVHQAGDVAGPVHLGRPGRRRPSSPPAPWSCRRNRSFASRSSRAARHWRRPCRCRTWGCADCCRCRFPTAPGSPRRWCWPPSPSADAGQHAAQKALSEWKAQTESASMKSAGRR